MRKRGSVYKGFKPPRRMLEHDLAAAVERPPTDLEEDSTQYVQMHTDLQFGGIEDLEDQMQSNTLDEGYEDQKVCLTKSNLNNEGEPCRDKAEVPNFSRDSFSPDLPDTSKMITWREQSPRMLQGRNSAKRARLERGPCQKDSRSVSLSIPSLSQLDEVYPKHVQKRALESCSQNTSDQQHQKNISASLLKASLDKADHIQKDKAFKGLKSVSHSDPNPNLLEQSHNLELESTKLEDSDDFEGREQVSKMSLENPRTFIVPIKASADKVEEISTEDSGKRLKGTLKDIDEDFHGAQELETLCSRSQNFGHEALQISIITEKSSSCKSSENGSQIKQFSEVRTEEKGKNLLSTTLRETSHLKEGNSTLAKTCEEISGSETRSHLNGFALPQTPSTSSGKQSRSQHSMRQSCESQHCEINNLEEKDEKIEHRSIMEKDTKQAFEQKISVSTLANEEDEIMESRNPIPITRQLDLPGFGNGSQEDILAQTKHRFQGLKVPDLSHDQLPGSVIPPLRSLLGNLKKKELSTKVPPLATLKDKIKIQGLLMPKKEPCQNTAGFVASMPNMLGALGLAPINQSQRSSTALLNFRPPKRLEPRMRNLMDFSKENVRLEFLESFPEIRDMMQETCDVKEST